MDAQLTQYNAKLGHMKGKAAEVRGRVPWSSR